MLSTNGGFEDKIFKDFPQSILMLKSEHPSTCYPYLLPTDYDDLYKIDSKLKYLKGYASIQVQLFSPMVNFKMINFSWFIKKYVIWTPSMDPPYPQGSRFVQTWINVHHLRIKLSSTLYWLFYLPLKESNKSIQFYKLKSIYLRTLWANFEWNWPSCCGEKVENVDIYTDCQTKGDHAEKLTWSWAFDQPR